MDPVLARRRPTLDASFDRFDLPPALLERARQLPRRRERHGVELPAAALNFPLRHPAVASVVVEVRSRDQLHDAVERIRTPVRDALWDELGLTENHPALGEG